MGDQTRDHFIASATRLFAERGFYGVSIANIAAELALTKQALLHHFGTKERLYGAVLKSLAQDLNESIKGTIEAQTTDFDRLLRVFSSLATQDEENIARVRLLVREMLDNKARADRARTWYLKPFLDRLTGLVKALPEWQEASDNQALAFIYQLLGAVNFYLLSEPTLKGIYGEETYNALNAGFQDQLSHLIVAGVKAGPLKGA